jgi:hypothetical protein
MKKNELKKKLFNENFPECTYSLDGGLPNEAFCLNKVLLSKWEVYYSERGNKSCLKYFSTEDEACDYFYELISNDEYVREMRNLKFHKKI